MGYAGMDGSSGVMGWGGMFFGPVLMIAIVALVIYAIVKLATPNTGAPNTGAQANPLDILQKRFASGEITADEYADGKQRLNS